ncbi:MAG: hypothetical protein RMI43_05025 [Candidatus Caldarchaeum sp.]|nr:hypothetical protein [Candidatus Caldarchaeum sp.]MCX8200665.1 hypothetical protein [Candidatus Caldarchaeum sp.]MDW8063513.1 hypothetical protein [Candidatus Caldarchaeum sp.]MDW8435650.1 hypothetical protein [Candidatus Caldarchaeum sp.]
MSFDLASKDFYLMLLDNALSKASKQISSVGDRVLEVRPHLVIDAKNTVLTNLGQLAKTLNREPAHLARFLLKETGRAGSISEDKLLIQGKMTHDEAGKLIDLYVKEFVKCPVCNGIDTRIVSEKRFRFLVCDACGAKNPVRRI